MSDNNNKLLPLFMDTIAAGFPSPAGDYLEKQIDLNDELISNKAATFLVRVSGRSMEDANIFDGDVLIIDRSLEPKNQAIIVAVIDGDFTVKRLEYKGDKVWLIPENTDFTPIDVSGNESFRVWGVVTYIIHKAQ